MRISLLGAGEISILTTRIPSVTQDFSLRHASSCCRLLFLLVPRGKPFMSADLKRIFLYFFEAEGGKSLKFSPLRITDRYCDFNELKPFRRGSVVVTRIINFYGEISRATKYLFFKSPQLQSRNQNDFRARKTLKFHLVKMLLASKFAMEKFEKFNYAKVELNFPMCFSILFPLFALLNFESQ